MSHKLKFLFLIIFAGGIFLNPGNSLARENVTDWYIQNFDSKIIVNKDSSLDITERITADCGNLPGKHGIFRILPEQINLTTGEKIKTPVKLISITDFDGRPVNYSESRNGADDTVTWKIGDPNKIVTGVNNYEIRYQVKNAILFGSPDFDELYWSLNGNFWDIETDRFHASLIFPEEVTETDSQVEYYTGTLGSKDKSLATYHWSAPGTLEFDSTKTIPVRQGISASVTFPKNIFTPFVAGFWETYGGYFFFLIPLAVFLMCFYLWWKYGKDPKVDKAIMAEYDAPGKLSPIELGMLMTNGSFKNSFITAEIVNLAVKKLITIKEIDNKILFFHSKDYELTKISDPGTENTLNSPQKSIFKKLFADGDTVKLSSLKNEFYKVLGDIKKNANASLADKGLISAKSMHYRTGFAVAGAIMIGGSFLTGSWSGYLAISSFLSGLILLIFSLVMPKRTLAGANLNWEIKGFRLFMEKVDKYRAEFYEKENIFEKFLPYAIIFGITGIWIQKMKEIYGENYYAAHAPLWYVGANAAAFDADSFNTAMSSLSSSIAASTSAPSGSGGAGGAGGGGGGGGGGGW